MSNKIKIICITPVKHIEGIYDYITSFGDVDYFPHIQKTELSLKNLKSYDVIFCNPNNQNYILDEEGLDSFTGTILTASTGLNHIDLKYCKAAGIKVMSHTKDPDLINNLPSTAELSFTLMMMMLRNTHMCKDHVASYMWDHTLFMGRQVKGLNIGIVGYGRLGKMMYNFCKSFGANVYVFDPYKKKEIDTVTLEEIVEKCDVISLHVHANKETTKMINKNTLLGCKKDLNVINTSRGCIVDENDIVDLIRTRKINGYATDVVVDEFGDIKNSPIVKCMNDGYNVIITPHIGGVTREGLARAYKWSIDKIKTIERNK